MSKRVGVAEVAARAGVSPGTVSNTLNHPERVSPATRDLVLAAVQELGFVPNQHARVLTGATSNLLGLVVVEILSNGLLVIFTKKKAILSQPKVLKRN